MSRVRFNGLTHRMTSEGTIPMDVFNEIMDTLENLLVFNDSPNLRWEISEVTGITLNVDPSEEGAAGGSSPVECEDLLPSVTSGDVMVTNGMVNNEIPLLGIGGQPLNSVPAPTLAGAGGDTTLWLKILHQPTAVAPTPPDTDFTMGAVTVISAEFFLDTMAQTDTVPSVDATTGATTDGEQYIRWADYVSGVQSAGNRCGSIQVGYCPETFSYYALFERVTVA